MQRLRRGREAAEAGSLEEAAQMAQAQVWGEYDLTTWLWGVVAELSL
jgi:hypothetical protein